MLVSMLHDASLVGRERFRSTALGGSGRPAATAATGTAPHGIEAATRHQAMSKKFQKTRFLAHRCGREDSLQLPDFADAGAFCCFLRSFINLMVKSPSGESFFQVPSATPRLPGRISGAPLSFYMDIHHSGAFLKSLTA